MAEIMIGDVRRVTKEGSMFFGRNGKVVDRLTADGARMFCLRFHPAHMVEWFYAHELTYVPVNEIPVTPDELAPAPAEPTGDGAADGVCRCGYPMSDHDANGDCPGDGYVGQGVSPSVFDAIERRIMKAGDVRFLEGIDEPIGLETAKYINNQSIALHNANKVAEAFAADADELRRQLAAAQAERDAARELLFEKGLIARRYIDALTQIDEYATEELGEWLPVQEDYMPTDKLTFSRIHAVAAQALQATGGEGSKGE